MEKKPTILVVDDQPSIRMGLAATIKRHGYEVITAVNGDDGFLKAQVISSRFDRLRRDDARPQRLRNETANVRRPFARAPSRLSFSPRAPPMKTA